jgi:hypothetical protein
MCVSLTCPVDDDVCFVPVEQTGAPDGARGVELAELEQAVEDRAVLAHIEPDGTDRRRQMTFRVLSGYGRCESSEASRGARTVSG